MHGTILIVPKKDSCGDRKAPTTRNDKDFKPCHVQGAESEHSNDECKRNKKNANVTNKSTTLKKRRHDAHLYGNRRRSSGDEPPSEYDTSVPSDGEVNDKSSNDKKSNSITLSMTLQKRGGWSRKTVRVTSPQLQKQVKHLWSLIWESKRYESLPRSIVHRNQMAIF